MPDQTQPRAESEFSAAPGSVRATPGKKYRGRTIPEWARHLGVPYEALQSRIQKGKRAGLNQQEAVLWATSR